MVWDISPFKMAFKTSTPYLFALEMMDFMIFTSESACPLDSW